ncbi:MAG: hypothetical protein U0165_05715 [Polyangiaceae bacterium]
MTVESTGDPSALATRDRFEECGPRVPLLPRVARATATTNRGLREKAAKRTFMGWNSPEIVYEWPVGAFHQKKAPTE